MGRNKNYNEYIKHDDCYEIIIQYKDEFHSAFIDIEDYELVSSYIWHLKPDSSNSEKFYARTGSEWQGIKYQKMHSIIMPNPPEGYVIDHIDGDRLNNRKSNLRYLTSSDNSRNIRPKSTSKSGIRGVSYNEKLYWRCDFTYNYKKFPTTNNLSKEDAVYLRYLLEKFYGLDIIINNPIAKELLTSTTINKEKIENRFNELINA